MSKPDEAQIISRFKQIQQMIEQELLQEAAQSLNALHSVVPNDPRLYWLGSLMAEAAGNVAGALESAQKAYDLHPQWAVAALRLAQVHARRQDFKPAIERVALAVKLATNQKSLNGDLLQQAAVVCLQIRQPKQAIEWLNQALTLAPHDAKLLATLANALAYDNQPERALALYDDLLLYFPGHPKLLLDRMLAHLKLKNLEDAARDCAVLLTQEPSNPVYQYYASLAAGETPSTLPSQNVSQLFDNYASRFDHHLVADLKYKLPKDVAALIASWHPNKDCDVLDLGCGTGLLGACLGPMTGVLVGVDLSNAMIQEAIKHRVYDKFHQVNVLDALLATPAGQYDVITALDMLIYVGDLTPVMPNVRRILNPGGRFVFSCETAPAGIDCFDLPEKTQRFRHSPSYVKDLLDQSGFVNVNVENRVLRYESGHPVDGFLVIAQS